MRNVYKKTWAKRGDFDEIIKSLSNAASVIITTSGISEKHKKFLLDEIVWKASEAPGKSKYDTRFISEAVHACDDDESEKVHFEHVRPRKKVISDLLQCPKDSTEILSHVLACTVTREEHRLLKDGEGWDRYQEAGWQVPIF